MRIVLKPLGVVVLVAAFATALLAPRFLSRSGPASPPSASTPRVGPAPAVAAGGAASLLRGPDFKFYTETPAVAEQKALAGADLPQGASSGTRFVVRTIGKNPWNVGYNNILTAESFRSGEPLTVSFRARSRSRSQVCALLQENREPYAHCWKRYVTLTPEWEEYTYTFPSARYDRGAALFALFLGFAPGTVDVADLRLTRGGDGSDGAGTSGGG